MPCSLPSATAAKVGVVEKAVAAFHRHSYRSKRGERGRRWVAGKLIEPGKRKRPFAALDAPASEPPLRLRRAGETVCACGVVQMALRA
jgi:hypothetical protein